MSFFFFLPSMLLSGFMFPFEAMPVPAQWIGTCLPLTHFLRIVRGILLKGASIGRLLGEVAAIAAFFCRRAHRRRASPSASGSTETFLVLNG